MTLVGYFNSLRELGGMRRLVDDDVSTRLPQIDATGPWAGDQRWLNARYVEELTSRLGSTDIPEILDQLGAGFDPLHGPGADQGGQRSRPLDVLLATNMISVGVDVPRLGLMVVGRPAQDDRRVHPGHQPGRPAPAPAWCCTVLNWARPRDLSHYETFEHYHATFYQHVEALSVTPFAAGRSTAA